ncbi:MAG TPA: hypothetical protein VMW35_18160 [Myxococcota bacterium]|nr:hypothetical protein [Myxococcota bacterium]
MPHLLRAGAYALVALLALAACSRTETAPTPAAPPTVNAAPPSAAPAPLSVSSIDLGRSLGADKSIAEAATEFAPSDTFYLSVKTSGAAPKAKLTALWTFEDGQSVAESSEDIAPTGPATTEFHVAKPDGWPTGSYRVQVFLDGRAVGTKELVVR